MLRVVSYGGGLTLAAIAVACPVASALTIQFHYGNRLEELSPQRSALDLAAARWSSVLHDPIVVTINAAFAEVGEQTGLGESVLAASWSDEIALSYADVRTALMADATSPDDQTAVEHLALEPPLVFRTRTPEGTTTFNSGNETINHQLVVTQANAKALGLPTHAAIDGEILFDHRLLDEVRSDFDPTDGVRGLDFVAIAAHEIGHILGFASGVSTIDAATLPHGPDAPQDVNDQAVLTTWDLFRYSPQSVPHLDLAPGGAPYFSIDGGPTNLAGLSSGSFNGDGYGPSHWTVGNGLMDPSWPEFTAIDITPLDLLALDVIGWDVVAVPEPSTFALTICTVLLIGSLRSFAPRRPLRCRLWTTHCPRLETQSPQSRRAENGGVHETR